MLSVNGFSLVVKLVEQFGIDVGVMMCLLDCFEVKGLCVCECFSEDCCVVMLSLIDEGCCIIEDLMVVLVDVFNVYLEGFSYDEWCQLIFFLQCMFVIGECLCGVGGFLVGVLFFDFFVD